jgi:hypothetical protein
MDTGGVPHPLYDLQRQGKHRDPVLTANLYAPADATANDGWPIVTVSNHYARLSVTD